jgi:hypothetical protein
MAKKQERTIEELRAEWERIRNGPFGPRYRFVHKAVAGSVLTPDEMSAEVQLLAKAKRRLESLCCTKAAFDDAWERGVGGEAFRERTPCHCRACGGKRKWPAYYVVDGVSLECLLDQHADDLPRSPLEVGYNIPRIGAIVLGDAAGPARGEEEGGPTKGRGKPLCEQCQAKPRATRQRYCAACLGKVKATLKGAGWPPGQTAKYLSVMNTFGNTEADLARAG